MGVYTLVTNTKISGEISLQVRGFVFCYYAAPSPLVNNSHKLLLFLSMCELPLDRSMNFLKRSKN